jgi:hypothetical protein
MKPESSGGEKMFCHKVHDPHCLFDNPDVRDIASRISHRTVAVYDGISDILFQVKKHLSIDEFSHKITTVFKELSYPPVECEGPICSNIDFKGTLANT